MFQIILLIVSYGSFLLLLMPATGIGVILTFLMLVFGVGMVVFKKLHKRILQYNKQYFLIPFSACINVYFCDIFHTRWLPSSKMQAIAKLLHMPIETMLCLGALILGVAAIYFVYISLQTITKKLSEEGRSNDFLFCIVMAVAMVFLAQYMIEVEIFSMGCWRFFAGVLIASTVILFLYCLIGRLMPSVVIGAGICMIIATINVYVYGFRGRLFEPTDLFSAGTAINVVGNYNLFPIPIKVIIGWAIFGSLLIVISCLGEKHDQIMSIKKHVSLFLICVVSSAAIFFYTSNLHTFHWDREGAVFNGYFLDFVAKCHEMTIKKPDNYSTDLIEELADQYTADSREQESGSSKYPHVIAIMDEAFSDLRVAGDFSTNVEVMPFISSLKENTVSGYTLASVYGGNTANSEYEFLTGNSLAWLSPNSVPYQQYIRSSTYSMVSHLASVGDYKTVAMHPFQANGWNRPLAYEHLGFDECYFVDDFPQEKMIRTFVSDQEMFEVLIETYEKQKEDPLFIFGVTMQNHGGYEYNGDNFTKHISLNGYGDAFGEVEQYLSLIHETDKAVENLITYFENVDEDVVIVFFGDHQPRLDDLFYETISGTNADNLDEQQKRFKVPFFVWANYDIEETYVDCTSLNYLSSYVYDVAGIPLPPYNRFLKKMEENIPSINANGFYSLADGCYLPIDEADGEALLWLEWYEALQYNNIVDKSHQNKLFFPVKSE